MPHAHTTTGRGRKCECEWQAMRAGQIFGVEFGAPEVPNGRVRPVLAGQSVSESVSQPISQSASQSIGQSASQSVSE